MTASLLFVIISAAILIQLAVGISVALRRRKASASKPATDDQRPASVSTAASPGLREFRVMRSEFEDRAHTQCSFYLEPVDGTTLPPFRAGQYLTFQLPEPDVIAGAAHDGRTITRCYSLSDQPNPAFYRVTIKRALPPRERPDIAAGLASTYFLDRVREGDILKVSAPAGRFFIDDDAVVPAVFIAGGIGVTPMMSMLSWCLKEQPGRRVHLYYGVRNSGEHAFKLMLEALAAAHSNFSLNVVYGVPGANDVCGRDFQAEGCIDVGLLKRILPHGRHQFYVCGPAAMMEGVVPALAEWGVPREDIHFEAFGPATVRFPDQTPLAGGRPLDTDFTIQFRRSARTLAWDGRDETLLDFAERHGVAVDSGCRTGSCGSCETALVSGRVHYANAPDYEIRPGSCLLCVGTPASALVLGA